MFKLLDGKLVSKEHEKVLKKNIGNNKLKLVIINASDSKESNKYICQKVKKCIDLGIEVELKEYDSETFDIYLRALKEMNQDNLAKWIGVLKALK